MTKYALAATGSTGNNTHTAVTPADHDNAQVAFQFVVEAVGGTPTVTFKYQGSLDGLTWTDVPYVPANTNTSATATQTVTGVGTTLNFLDINSGARLFEQFRCVTTANTNVTYRAELYTFMGNRD